MTETYSGAVDTTSDAFDLIENPSWWPEAACRNLPDNQLYLNRASTETIFFDGRAANQAKAVCRSCDHQAECLLRVLGNEGMDAFYGTVGGLGSGDRKRFTGMLVDIGLLKMPEPAHGTAARASRCQCDLCAPALRETNRQAKARKHATYLTETVTVGPKDDCGGWSADMVPMKDEAA
jgi:hypothetical protein